MGVATVEYVELMGRANRFVAAAKELNDDNNSKIRMRNNLSLRLEELRGQSRELGEELDNLVNAVALLNKISDDLLQNALRKLIKQIPPNRHTGFTK